MTDTQTFNDVEFIKFIIDNIVDEKDKVSIERIVDSLGVLIKVKVSKNDMGKVVGKKGQTANALRTLLNILASKSGEHVNLKIEEPVEL
jgi:hypothetical protein